MRTDAILFNMRDGRRDTTVRMDRSQENLKNDPDQGFGLSNDRKNPSDFRETYERIADSNRSAQDVTERNTAAKVQDKRKIPENRENDYPEKDSVGPDNSDVATKDLNDSSTSGDKGKTDEEQKTKKREQAEATVREAIADVSELLNINIQPGIDQLSLKNLDENSTEQFAEILYSLKKISEVLDQSAAQNQSIQIGKLNIDPDQAMEMSSKIKTEIFRIEIGLNMLGVSQNVQDKLSVKLEQQLSSQGGIPQASNPSELSMSAGQVRQALGNALADPKANVDELAKQVAQFLKENGADKSLSVSDLSSQQNQVKNAVPQQFDTKTLRAMLKIDDGTSKTAVENSDAASKNEKLDLPGVLNPAIAKNPAEIQKADIEQLPLADIGKIVSGPQGQNQQLFEPKLSANPQRVFEQSVLNQVSENLNAAIKSGITEVRIQLRPETLGEVQLKIRVEGDIVTARIQVESQQVKHIVESNLQNLKDSLSQQHLQAGSLEVSVGNHGGRDPSFADNQAWGGNLKGNADSTDSSTNSNNSETATGNVSSGQDTGRRFGSNTIEFFA
jgi:flagellar hook-length control protein FliK